jgi:NAD(P)H dehydrogenase (quinone)
MSQPKIAIVYYSTYGTNHEMAQVAEKAALEAGAEVRVRRVAETAPDDVVAGQDAWKAQAERQASVEVATGEDLEWADGFIFSTPTRFGGAASQLRSFIDTLGPQWQAGALANKTVTAMTTAQNPHGGQEATILGLYTTFMHWGSIIVAPGYTDPVLFESGGNPYGFSTVGGGLDDAGRNAIAHQARRLVDVTRKLTA